jgi:hypothetical protein
MKHMLNHSAMVAALALATLLIACRSSRDASRVRASGQSPCNHQPAYTYTKADLPQPLHQEQLPPVLTKFFSPLALHTANAIGLLPDLITLIQCRQAVQQEPGIENRLALLEAHHRALHRISIASLEVAAVASELDCEEERADQLAVYLKGKEDARETRLTVGAIVVGGLGAIAAGILLASDTESNAAEVIGIGTGLTEAALGVLIWQNEQTASFRHPRNALRDIWEGPETSRIFPPSVWYYLNHPLPGQADKSIRQQLVERWAALGQAPDQSTRANRTSLPLFWGEGGMYSANDLENRANMYDQLEAQVNLMQQDLKQLALAVEALMRQ